MILAFLFVRDHTRFKDKCTTALAIVVILPAEEKRVRFSCFVICKYING
jgi:hypothetical protein